MKEFMPNTPVKTPFFLISIAVLLILSALPAAPLAVAKSAEKHVETSRFIIEFKDPPVTLYDGRELSEPAAAGSTKGPAPANIAS